MQGPVMTPHTLMSHTLISPNLVGSQELVFDVEVSEDDVQLDVEVLEQLQLDVEVLEQLQLEVVELPEQLHEQLQESPYDSQSELDDLDTEKSSQQSVSVLLEVNVLQSFALDFISFLAFLRDFLPILYNRFSK
jgi:hypothetical protein